MDNPPEPRIMINGVWLPENRRWEFIEAGQDSPATDRAYKFAVSPPGITGLRVWRDIAADWRTHEYCDVKVTRQPGERPIYAFRERPDVQTFPDCYAPAFSLEGDTIWTQVRPFPDWAHRSSLFNPQRP